MANFPESIYIYISFLKFRASDIYSVAKTNIYVYSVYSFDDQTLINLLTGLLTTYPVALGSRSDFLKF